MPGMTQNLTEDNPFFPPLPFGWESVREFECICDHDPYHTGDPDRAGGCGCRYYTRISISPRGIVHNERTNCRCTLEYQARVQPEVEAANRINQRRSLCQEIDALFRPWNLLRDDAYSHMRLEKFKPEDITHEKALKYLRNYRLEQGGICLYGRQGRGKTHLAFGLARKMEQMGYAVLVLKSIDLLNRLKRCYIAKDDQKEVQVMNILKRADLLVIDDIGTEKPTGWVLEKLYEVIDYRNARSATIFTTNLDGEEMERKLGGPLTSRVFGAGVQLLISGRDWRIKDDGWAEYGQEVIFEEDLP